MVGSVARFSYTSISFDLLVPIKPESNLVKVIRPNQTKSNHFRKNGIQGIFTGFTGISRRAIHSSRSFTVSETQIVGPRNQAQSSPIKPNQGESRGNNRIAQPGRQAEDLPLLALIAPLAAAKATPLPQPCSHAAAIAPAYAPQAPPADPRSFATAPERPRSPTAPPHTANSQRARQSRKSRSRTASRPLRQIQVSCSGVNSGLTVRRPATSQASDDSCTRPSASTDRRSLQSVQSSMQGKSQAVS